MFEIPPMFNMQAGKLIFFDLIRYLWKMGVKGAPSPPLTISFFLKLKTTFFFVS